MNTSISALGNFSDLVVLFVFPSAARTQQWEREWKFPKGFLQKYPSFPAST